MRIYTQEELESLTRCPKKIVDPPRRSPALANGHYQNGMILESLDGKHKFHAFMRQNAKFPEDFSVGLEYLPEDGSPDITLIRCNGPHWTEKDGWPTDDYHFHYHVHKALKENIEAGLKPERYAVITREYATFEDAITYFVQYCSIQGANAYFSFLHQLPLFQLEGYL